MSLNRIKYVGQHTNKDIITYKLTGQDAIGMKMVYQCWRFGLSKVAGDPRIAGF